MSKRAAIYARVSTEDQAEHGYSLPSQLDACRQYAAQHGFKVVAEEPDEAVSGATLERPGLDRLRALIDRREVEAVIVYTSDRLSRNLAQSLVLRDEWRNKVELHCVDRGQADDTAEGRLLENIEAVIAEFEREQIRERMRRGKLAKAAAGKWVGGVPTPYGYMTQGRGRDVGLVVDPREAVVVQRMFSMYTNDRASLRAIAETLTREGVPPPNKGPGNGRGWYVRTVKAILQRKAYVGEFSYRGHPIRLPDLAIVGRATWQAAQAQRERNIARCRRNRKHDYLLSSHIRCTCGRAMGGIWAKKRGGGKYLYYHCTGDDKHLQNCREKWLRADVADVVVWQWVYDLISHDAKWEAGLEEWRQRDAAEVGPHRQRLQMLEETIERKAAKVKRLTALAGDAQDDELAADYDAQAKAEQKQRAALAAERDKLAAQLERVGLTPAKEANVRATIRAIQARVDGANYAQKRDALDLLNVTCQLGYKDGERGLWCSLSLAVEPEFLPVDSRLESDGEGEHAGGLPGRRVHVRIASVELPLGAAG